MPIFIAFMDVSRNISASFGLYPTTWICSPDVVPERVMPKVNLTDPKIKALKASPPGKRIDYSDSQIPGLGVRVNDKGRRTFVFYQRFPGSSGAVHNSRRALGVYPSMSLAEARAKATEWRRLIGQGIDPTEFEQRQREAERQRKDAELRQRQNTFARVAEDFIREKVLGPKCYD
jgi:hypothetical protein